MFTQVPEGWTVRYQHQREKEAAPRVVGDFQFGRVVTYDERVLPRGGTTTAAVYDREGRLRGFGIAWCRPDEQYVKEIGRELALYRAMHGAEARHIYDVIVALRETRQGVRLKAAPSGEEIEARRAALPAVERERRGERRLDRERWGEQDALGRTF